MNLISGILFHDRYKLIQLIGSGGMSQVWEVHDTMLFNEVNALKIYTYDGASNEKIKDAFRHEFVLMKSFNHPNLLKPSHLDFDILTGAPYMVMKLYKRGSADKIINQNELGIEEKVAAQFLKDAASALHIIHSDSRKIIHQDIKPDNFLIDDDGKYILSDFGVSIRKRETSLIEKRETPKAEGSYIAGQQEYVAPERFKGAPPHSSQDIFSLGVTLYEILTGVLPFQNWGGRLLNSDDNIPDLSPEFGYSARLNNICKRCMSTEPEARPSATQLMDWANFYLLNGYWEELPHIDISKIRLRKALKNTSLVYDRISIQKLDEIDGDELNKCILEFQKIKESRTEEFKDVSKKLNRLYQIRVELDNLNDIEKDLRSLNSSLDPNTQDVLSIKDKLDKLSIRLSERYYIRKMKELDTFFEAIISKRDIADQIDEFLAIPLEDFDPLEAEIFIKNNNSFRTQLKNSFENLESKINQANDYNKNIDLLNKELDRGFLKADLTLIQNSVKLIESRGLVVPERINKKISEYVKGSTIFNELKAQYQKAKIEAQNHEINDNDIFSLKKGYKTIKKEVALLMKDFGSNKTLLELDKDIQKELDSLEKRKVKPSDQKDSIQTKEEVDYRIPKAEKLFEEVLFYLKQENFTIETLNTNLGKIATSINFYTEGSVGGKIPVGGKLRKAKELQDKIIRLLDDEKEKQVVLNDKLSQADKLCNEVNVFVEAKEYTNKTLKANLEIIRRSIDIYSGVLATAPGPIGKKRKRANDLMEIILEELRKRRRGVMFWFFRGAAVFIPVLLFIVLSIGKKDKSGGEESVTPEDTGAIVMGGGKRGDGAIEGSTNDPLGSLTTTNENTSSTAANIEIKVETKEVSISQTRSNTGIEQGIKVDSPETNNPKAQEQLKPLGPQKNQEQPTTQEQPKAQEQLKAVEQPITKKLSIDKINANRGTPNARIKKPMELTAIVTGGEGNVLYEWKQIAGPKVTNFSSDKNSSKLVFILPDNGKYKFELTVIDSKGNIIKSEPYCFTATNSGNE